MEASGVVLDLKVDMEAVGTLEDGIFPTGFRFCSFRFHHRRRHHASPARSGQRIHHRPESGRPCGHRPCWMLPTSPGNCWPPRQRCRWNRTDALVSELLNGAALASAVKPPGRGRASRPTRGLVPNPAPESKPKPAPVQRFGPRPRTKPRSQNPRPGLPRRPWLNPKP